MVFGLLRYEFYCYLRVVILSGKQLSDNIKAQLAQEVATFPEKYGRVPHLAVVLVGDDPASATYVRSKGKACDLLGIQNTTIHLPQNTSEEALLAQIRLLNEDEGVDGILVQLPLPDHIDEMKALYAIAREKDVDGFHPLNLAALYQNRPCILPCTPKGIIRMLKAANVSIEGKRAVVVGRSNIVGMPVARLLMNENATVTIAHSHTINLAEITRQAEILVVATGHAHLITEDMVSDGVVVIDVGISRNPQTGKLVGDVDFDNVAAKASVITPVPGGVGPMTICSLMENTVECFINRMKFKKNY